MRSLPFSLLTLTCFLVLLGVRFALEPLAERVADVVRDEAVAESVMMMPPKPEGLGEPAAGEGDGEGEGTRLTREACQTMAPALRDVCWQALARQSGARDPEGAL
ncbi:MAG: hypothetical protein ACOZNI_18655, partial [Myxococcota bacterium]